MFQCICIIVRSLNLVFAEVIESLKLLKLGLNESSR